MSRSARHPSDPSAAAVPPSPAPEQGRATAGAHGAIDATMTSPVPSALLSPVAELAQRPARAVRRSSIRQDGGPTQSSPFNGMMVWGLLLLAFVAPLPVGSNRPALWALWAAVIGIALAVHLAFVRGNPLKDTYGDLRWAISFALALPIWGLVQMMPWLGGGISLPSGAEFGLLLGVDVTQLHGRSISLAPQVTGLAVMRMLAHVALFVLVLRLISRNSRANAVLHWLFYGITLHAVWAMMNLKFLGDVAIWGEKTAYLGAATGPFVNRNSFASYLGMGVVLGVALLMDRGNRPRLRTPHLRAIFSPENLSLLVVGLCTALIFVALLATQSRAGLAATLVGAAVAWAVMAQAQAIHTQPLAKGQRVLARRILMGIAALALLVALVQGIASGVLERGIFASADWGLRERIYANAIDRILERPLTGYGLDTFALAYEMGRDADRLTETTQVDAHSTYLENWVDAGLIFGSAMLLAGLAYLRRLWALLPRRDTAGTGGQPAPRSPALAAAALGVFALAALHSLVDFSFEIEANVMVMIIILAVGVAPLRQKTRNN